MANEGELAVPLEVSTFPQIGQTDEGELNENSHGEAGDVGLTDKEAESRFIEWYEEICKERITMSAVEEDYRTQIKEYQETEASYKRRVTELETNVGDLVKAFEEAQNETKILRTKYEPEDSENKDAYAEPYNIVVKEKMKLLGLQLHHQARIKTLERELDLLRKYVKDLESTQEVKPKKTDKSRRKSLVVITNSERLQALETENSHLKYMNEKALAERKALNVQVNMLETRLKQIEITSPKNGKPIKRIQSDITMNRKCVPTFLPKIDTPLKKDCSVNEFPTNRLTSSRSSFSLDQSYKEIYQRRRVCSDSSTVNSAYQSIYKYML